MGRYEVRWWVPLAIALFWVFMMGLGCVYLAPGSTGRYVPETPRPSPERLSELIQIPPGREPPNPPRTMRVEVSPRLILEGRSALARCFIPRSAKNRTMRLFTADSSMYRELGNSSDEFEFRLPIDRPLCGSYEVVCAVQRSDGTISQRTADLTVLGECNQGEGG